MTNRDNRVIVKCLTEGRTVAPQGWWEPLSLESERTRRVPWRTRVPYPGRDLVPGRTPTRTPRKALPPTGRLKGRSSGAEDDGRPVSMGLKPDREPHPRGYPGPYTDILTKKRGVNKLGPKFDLSSPPPSFLPSSPTPPFFSSSTRPDRGRVRGRRDEGS